jgi:hypothetical protein
VRFYETNKNTLSKGALEREINGHRAQRSSRTRFPLRPEQVFEIHPAQTQRASEPRGKLASRKILQEKAARTCIITATAATPSPSLRSQRISSAISAFKSFLPASPRTIPLFRFTDEWTMQ